MPQLSSNQREYLRKTAHDLRPVVQIGKQGLTEALVKAIETALTAHELIKIKFIEHKEEKRDLANEIVSATGSELVAIIGNVAILYRESPNQEKRKIVLPAS